MAKRDRVAVDDKTRGQVHVRVAVHRSQATTRSRALAQAFEPAPGTDIVLCAHEVADDLGKEVKPDCYRDRRETTARPVASCTGLRNPQTEGKQFKA